MKSTYDDAPNIFEFEEGISWVCSVCKEKSAGFGNNPQPVKNLKVEDRCCDACNEKFVMPRRWRESRKEIN